MSVHYVYEYWIDGFVAYVGKGQNVRCLDHLFRKANLPFQNTLRKAIAEQRSVELRINYAVDDHKRALAEEVRRIALYGRRDLGTGTLYNLTDGGEGTLGSAHNRGRIHTAEARSRMGCPKGHKQSDDHIAAVVAKTKGTKRSEKTKQRIAEANKGRPCANREQLIAYHAKRKAEGTNKQSAEACEAKRQKMKAYWAKRREAAS